MGCPILVDLLFIQDVVLDMVYQPVIKIGMLALSGDCFSDRSSIIIFSLYLERGHLFYVYGGMCLSRWY